MRGIGDGGRSAVAGETIGEQFLDGGRGLSAHFDETGTGGRRNFFRALGETNDDDSHQRGAVERFFRRGLKQAATIADRDDARSRIVLAELSDLEQNGEFGGAIAGDIARSPRGVVDYGHTGVAVGAGVSEGRGEDEQRGGGSGIMPFNYAGAVPVLRSETEVVTIGNPL